MELNDLKKAGYSACMQGLPLISNPFMGDTAFGEAWEAGWRAAYFTNSDSMYKENSKPAKSKEFYQGYEAFLKGELRETDPYWNSSDLANKDMRKSVEWVMGWNTAYLDEDKAIFGE